jgi:predicted AlkP superfamily phosphohydrolase/phosphomutase
LGGGLLFFLPALYLLAHNVFNTTTPKADSSLRWQPRQKVILLGIDGATWDVLEPAINANMLPNFAHLRANASYGNLMSEIAVNQPFANSASLGMRTPVIWETIVTGKSPREHGIWDFYSSHLPGMKEDISFRIPLPEWFSPQFITNSQTGKEKRLWEILDDSGVTSAVVGWFNTWPAYQLSHGVLLSDRAHYPTGNAVAFPANRRPEKGALLRRDFESGARLVGLDYDMQQSSNHDDATAGQERGMVRTLAKDLARDKYYAEAALNILAVDAPEFLAVYFTSTDDAQHLFWQYYEPEHFPSVAQTSIQRYGDVIPRVYQFVDDYLGKILRHADEATTLIIVSDHGAGPWIERDSGLSLFPGKSYHPTYSGNHRRNGIIFLHGQDILKGHRLPDTSIYDVLPTTLHILGFPVSAELTGRVVTEAFEDDYIARIPVRMTPTYGARGITSVELKRGETEKQIRERLKALGYVQ